MFGFHGHRSRAWTIFWYMRRITCPVNEVGWGLPIFLRSCDPDLSIQFVTYRMLPQRLNHVIGKSSFKPITDATKYFAHAQYHVVCA